MTSGTRRSWIRWLVVAAIFVGATAYNLRTETIPSTAFFGGDTWEYQSMAVNFAHGHGLKIGAILPWDAYQFDPRVPQESLEMLDLFEEVGRNGGRDNFYRTPGYPVLLGALYAIVGVRPDIAMLIQMLVVIAIGSVLPLLGERVFGTAGFAAGIPAGAIVAFALAPDALAIMTETLIMVACLLILLSWIALTTRRTPALALLFGLTLALGLLVKGSLIFAPPLFFGYMLLRWGRSRTFTVGTMLAVLLGLAVPILAWSTWASSRAGKPILLTTQGRVVLLDGHNEQVAETGDWSPHWRDDPRSFHNRALAADPGAGSASIVARFYLDQPSRVFTLMVAKIRSAGRAHDVAHLLAIHLLLALLLFRATMLAFRDAPPRVRFVACLVAAALVIGTRADPATLITGTIVVGLGGLRGPSFREALTDAWNDTARMGAVIIPISFLVLVLATFGDPRFLWPALFVLLLWSLHLLLRVLGDLEILPGLPLMPAAGRERSAIGTLYLALRRSAYMSVAREINLLARYVDQVLFSATSDDPLLYEQLSDSRRTRLTSLDAGALPEPEAGRCRLLVLNGTFNTSLDIQSLLTGLKPRLARQDRVAVVLYNPYLRGLWALLDRTGLRSAPPARTFVTRRSLVSLATLSGFHLVRLRPAASFPFRLLGLGTMLDGLMKALPVVRHAALVNVALLRPVVPSPTPPSLSVVIPARNEAGNIRAALDRMPLLPGVETEVIFVEGGSTDDTADEIRKVIEDYSGPLKLKSFTQPGKGKGDAVRVGFAHATGDLLTILDADLTMPPEMLPRFFEAYREGLGDFVNGNRLLYPMEGEAMRFLNTLGNIFFSKALAWILESPLNDTLCGTKLLSRQDWERLTRWRADFGDFDPFGDFEMLFSAATMALGIVEVPVHYRARTYGATNIHRFRHGLMLARMSLIGFVRIRMGLGGPRSRRDR